MDVSYASDILEERIRFNGSIVCEATVPYLNRHPLRTWARMASDQHFPELGDAPSEYRGTIFRFVKDGPNQLFTGALTRKEALFGEYGPRGVNHEALVTLNRMEVGNLVVVTYQDLSAEDLDYVRKILQQIGLREL